MTCNRCLCGYLDAFLSVADPMYKSENNAGNAVQFWGKIIPNL